MRLQMPTLAHRRLPNLLVRVKGSDAPVRGPLKAKLLPDESGSARLIDEDSQRPFEEYLAQRLDMKVADIYYKTRDVERSSHQKTKFVRFDGHGNPFVGGMEVIICKHGDTAPEEASRSRCSLM